MSTSDFLRKHVSALSGLSDARLEALVKGSVVKTHEAGEVIARSGTEAAHFGVILDGSVTASIPDANGVRRVLGQLETGETFGELALMTGDPWMADLTADSRCELLLVPVSLFQSIVVAEPEAAKQIWKTISSRVQTVARAGTTGAAAAGAREDPHGLSLRSDPPAKVLVVNCGSSSLKYSFYDTSREESSTRGLVERIGIDGTNLSQKGPKGDVQQSLSRGGHREALEAMVTALTSAGKGPIGRLGEVSVVAHRVVHGGERFSDAAIITDETLAHIEALSPLAPLHNPVNAAGIRELKRLIPSAPHVAVFDTAFHHTLPPHSFLYGVPYELYEEKRVRRFGFHGTSHHYVSLRAAQFLKRRPGELRIVTCHLGNGSSLCALEHGRSVDTSMGFTAIEGLIMGARCGDLDVGVVSFLERTGGMKAPEIEEMLNKRSGLLGISGVSSDMRDVLRAANEGNRRALLAFRAYCYRLRKYIGAYVAALGGVDALVFTGGIGQGSAEARALALQGLDCMGLQLDDRRNQEARGFEETCRISAEGSRAAILVVPTDEERMMAREALRALGRSRVDQAREAQQAGPIPVEVSAHHVHLTQENVEALFGKGHQLTRVSDLSQPGQFACEEQVVIVGPKGRIERVRVLGPPRKQTQVEIAMTEQFKLGIHPPIRESGDIADTPGCVLEGTAGSVQLSRGVICALRHVHMTPENALRYGVRDKAVVRVRVLGDRELIFGDVLVRVDPNFSLAMHIDTDEANAANLKTGAQGILEGVQSPG